jgi:nitrite reductase/ring-hydroxylating ferredoxin subunit
VCAHAGGPLDKGTLTPDGCLECPWHGARYRLADGSLRRGPSVYDQPAYEIRAREGGGYEVRRAAS